MSGLLSGLVILAVGLLLAGPAPQQPGGAAASCRPPVRLAFRRQPLGLGCHAACLRRVSPASPGSPPARWCWSARRICHAGDEPAPACRPGIRPAAGRSAAVRRLAGAVSGNELQRARLRDRIPRKSAGQMPPGTPSPPSLHQTAGLNWQTADDLRQSFRDAADRASSRAPGTPQSGAGTDRGGDCPAAGAVCPGVRPAASASAGGHRTEIALRRLETLLEATGEGVYQVNAQGLCTYINPAGAALLGYQPKELLGQRDGKPAVHQSRRRCRRPSRIHWTTPFAAPC